MLKNFKVNVAARILFLIILVLALVYFLQNTEFYITMFILLILIIISFVGLIRYVDQTNRDFTAFLLGIKYEDFSATYSGYHKGKTFGDLYEAFNQINKKFLDIRSETEAHFQYLQTVVEHVNVGLLCLDEQGEVALMNKGLAKLLKKPYMRSVKDLQLINEQLYQTVAKIQAGERELIKVVIQDQLSQIALRATEFKLKNEQFKLVSMQNIKSELEEQELDAWQKLIRILTHEIMNSVAPIFSLSSTINDLIAVNRQELGEEDIQDIRDAIGAISKRSQGLLGFTETYRNLTRIPIPKIRSVNAHQLIKRIYVLLKPVFTEQQIQVDLVLPSSEIFFQVDAELIEQVMINLIKNAIDALKGQTDAQIKIILQKTATSTTIKVSDNGPGISEEVMEQIFVPFFTTKQEGSGIGLSLSRQIMRMHKGSINVQSAEGSGTIFELIF
ncbi:MAG: ATP-binding protein [Bacteroidota bacterium]